MSFDEPAFLLGLLALPLLAWAYARREQTSTAAREAFAPAALLPSVAPLRAGWRRHAPVAAYGLALAALLVALSRPQATLAVAVEQATVVVVTDRSGSMEATDVAPSRLEAAREAAQDFVGDLPEELRVGLIAFNHTVQVLHSPTRDHAEVSAALGGIQAAGSTATGDALATALKLLADARKPGSAPPPAAIVLLSDGKSVRGSDPLDAADQARKAGIPIHTVALGTDEGTIERQRASGAVETVQVPPDTETLRRIAERSRGEAFEAAGATSLERVYEQLESQVTKERRPREVTNLFAGGALLLIAGAAAASLRWFGRVL